jgi:hypothetical protein
MGTGIRRYEVARRQASVAFDAVVSDMEWVASTLPDPLDVIDRCVDTVVVHWHQLTQEERRRVLAEVNDKFLAALAADQGRMVAA